MTLWFDVTDLRHWGLGHLTGIQRTSVSVLAELLTIRNDIELFAFDSANKVLQKVDIHSLAPVIRDSLASTRGVNGDGQKTEPVSSCRQITPVTGRARRQLKSAIRKKLKELLGDEATDALRETRRAFGNFLRAVRKQISMRIARTNRPFKIAGPVLFKQGDVCISLSATWGFQDYGEGLAAYKQASGAAYINLIYDLIPALFPAWMPPHHSEVFTRWVTQQIANSDLILTISQFQKNEIARFIETERLASRPVEVIRLGDNPNMNSGLPVELLPRPRYVPERKFVICVSTIDPRKNQGLLYRVWQRLVEELGPDCPQLLLIGTPHPHVSDFLHQIRYDRSVNKVIVHQADVSDEELAWYYKHCAFTIYPSIYEGWGLPISESLSLGRYCIAGNRTSLPEAGGDLVDYFDPFDFAACYKLVYRAVTDPDYVQAYEERIRTNYVPHSWAQTAAHISGIVDRLSDPDRGRVD